MVHRLVQEDGDKVKFVFRHLPLSNIHRWALMGAEATEAAGEQGKFWEMIDRLFANQNNLSEEMIYNTAQEIGLDMNSFRDSMTQHKHLAKIQADVQEAVNKRIGGTPTFFIDGSMVAGGLPTFDKLQAAVQKELQSK